jgi:hypothetical protein
MTYQNLSFRSHFPFYHNVYRFIADIKSSWKTWRETICFETVIIIALGSAAGDPMFYEEVGIIPP